MAHLTSSVEYALHCLLWLADGETSASSRDLAELQGISPSFVAKILPRLEKAGIVESSGGVRGGYRLARAPGAISFLDVIDAVEGDKPLFECQEIRARCTLFEDCAPDWATRGVCGIHAVMLEAERAMREALAARSLADVAAGVARKAPAAFDTEVRSWLAQRHAARTPSRRPRSD